MPSSRANDPLSRRSILRHSLGAGFALGAGDALSRAAAQDATPVTSPTARASHAIVGAWKLVLLDEPSSFPTTAIFSDDGVYIEYDQDIRFGVGIGFWRTFEPHTGEYVVNFQQLASSQESSPEKEHFSLNYVPEGHEFLPGVVSLRVSFEIDPSGNAFTTFGRMEVRDGDGNMIAGPFGTGGIAGTRLVEATS